MTNKEKLKQAIEQDMHPSDYYREIIAKIEKGEKVKKIVIYGSGLLYQFV